MSQFDVTRDVPKMHHMLVKSRLFSTAVIKHGSKTSFVFFEQKIKVLF